jgi:hypothetical protein
MRITLTAALLLMAGLAAAQSPTTPNGGSPAPSAQSNIHADKKAIRQDNAAQRAQIADLNSQEKAAMDAVTADTTLSKADSNSAKRKIHAEFKVKKDAIRVQMKADRKSKRADIHAEQQQIRQDHPERTEAKGQ